MDKGYDSEKIHSLISRRKKIRFNHTFKKKREKENLGKMQKTDALNI
jgi:hypothetical protein